MANEISIGKQAIKEVQDLRAELVKLSEDALKAGKNLSTISTPGALNKNGADNAKLIAELDTLKLKYDALGDEVIDLNNKLTKLNETRRNGKKLTAEEIVANQVQRKEAIELAKANSELIGSYDKLNLKHQQAVKNAQNIGVTYGITSKEFIKASEKANKLDVELKELDASLGKHQRNVGNYKSGFNALGNSISQLSREMPAFANSAQTGFMAISNNIPAFQDAIMQLRAGGMSWGGILKEMGASLFGLTGIISLATTALVVLGPKIIDWITNTDDEKEATDRLTASLKKQNEQLKIYNENIEHQAILAGENAKQRGASIKETQSIERKSIEDQLKNFERARDARKKDFDDFVKTEARKRMPYFASPVGFAERVKAMEKVVRAEASIQKNAFIEAENAVKRQGVILSELIEKQQTERIEQAKKNAKKAKKEDTTPKVERLESSLKSIGTIIAQVNEEIDRLLTEKVISDESALPAINFQLEQLYKLKKQIEGSPEVDLKIINTTVKSKQAIKQLTEEMRNYLKTFTIDFAQNAGFTETFALLNDEIDGFGENFAVTFNAIAESAQEVFNFISNASKKNFDSEKERLQSQYDVALKFAGDNKEAQEKLAEDLEKQKADIANREAKAKQKQAIFNIAIDTAQSIMGLWANPGFPAAIPLAILVGALGAAQIAMVASQEIPQYWMGGTHDGGLMMVNDGAGNNYRETIVTPDGKIHKPQGKNVIMNAPVGTEIFTHDQWNDQLNGMLKGNNISWHNQQQYNGITKNEMKEAMLEAIGEQPQYHTNFDANGASSYISKRGNITRTNTARSNGRGIKY